MGRPIDITRLEHSATALRELAAKTHDGAVVRRLLAIALILEGHSREEAARRNGMDRQILRDWVHRYNADGVAGLRSRWGPGRPPALNKTQWRSFGRWCWKDRTWRATGWCAGAALTCARRSLLVGR